MKAKLLRSGLLLFALSQNLNFLFFLSVDFEYCGAFSANGGNSLGTLIAHQQVGKEQTKQAVGFRRRSSLALGAERDCRVAISTNSSDSVAGEPYNENDTSHNDLEAVKSLTRTAMYRCGTEEGLDALKSLRELCDNRLPFDFDSVHRRQTYGGRFSSPDPRNAAIDQGEETISLLPGFLPTQAVGDFLESVRCMEEQGWMSTNPDSVDGLPSLHLNLVSQGKPLFDETPPSCDDSRESPSEYCDEDSFESQIFRLYDIVRPYVYEELLPKVDQLLNNANKSTPRKRKLRVSDVFLRRYGQDICGDVTRNGISIHYDVYSRVTAVVALDEVAAEGDNGLFTLTVDENTGETSNHKALRRFFPLRTGDCVVHTWDVLHGVDVQPGLDRTSLIVWFDEVAEGEGQNEAESVSPWLSLESQNAPPGVTTLQNGNDVRQFVLASALSSLEGDEDTELEEILLYLRSASRGNTFALTRMGSICDEGALSSPELQKEAVQLLDRLRPFKNLPEILQGLLEGNDAQNQLACRFWFEASLSGNPLAQKALANEIMFRASQSERPDQRLLAAVLFALASQQEDEDGPSDSLSRVIEHDLAARNVQSQEEFLASPVVQTAKAAFGAA
ncbi:unnamed protein product [Pseudo-nitzschia multistriata]|uniref:Fe2OG dioxygenase domain-containing protein n=1 Tax=Pseudo-nitzschia multistriata TaxID=183589 RepID=A0A448ZD09_9STRA|nr:unnamed protein product [Pseudo-nitzschia multistriata]